MNIIRLTQYSHGAGCGCKISPRQLSDILQSEIKPVHDLNLLVGNENQDDAAVYDLGNGSAVISTTDFFMPIVDDPFTFGRIAAVNALSDVYAMGGMPLMAVAILGWPVDKLSSAVARKVLDGGRQVCNDAGIPLAGGHSIDNPEPLFGLAVTGLVETGKMKKNNTATPGCRLFLTKPLGIGILTTAEKKGLLKKEHAGIAASYMCLPNSIGMELAEQESVKAMTDVTGFGLLGHLTEMCRGSNLSAVIEYDKVPKLDMLDEYVKQKSMPGGTKTNWESYRKDIELENPDYRYILCDPQTSGGLLIAVEEEAADNIAGLLKRNGLEYKAFGRLTDRQEPLIKVV